MVTQQITTATIQGQIIHLPGREPFMLGQDLAAVYETEPRAIAQAVKRNPGRFPDDFVFQLTDEETAILKTQSATSNPGLKSQNGTSNPSLRSQSVTANLAMSRANPLGFTQAGANMLSTVLKSPVAVERSVQIMRAFTAMEAQAAKETMRRARQTARQGQLEWQANRANGVAIRRELTDAIQAFIEYARGQGSTHAERYYSNLTRMTRSVLGERANRDDLDAGQLVALAMAERIAAQAIQAGVQAALPYKAIYQAAKGRVTTMVAMMNGAGTVPMLTGPANSPGRLAVAV
ncbi:MAG: ORF6N domain-containing protein [Magnetococcales bacterium]|nr:ORF6N domain-containing protein [Magnetococcales bacterium]